MSLFKEYFRFLIDNPTRLVLFCAICLFFLTVPSRLIYSFPNLENRGPIFREIDMPLPTPNLYPVNKTGAAAPNLTARSAIAVDIDSKAVIFLKNPDEHLLPASTTKMVTALVALQEYNLTDVVIIKNPVYIGQIMELQEDEQITIENLLYGLLVHSGNDVAQALADLHPRGSEVFIEKMNEIVKSLGLKDTHFTNPTGLEDSEHYSTVHDLAIIGAEVISHPELEKMVSTKTITVTDVSGEIVHELENINELLGIVPGLKGIKTGWTENAGECLVAYTERDGHRVITAILGSYDRFGETRILVDWIFNNHKWEKIQLAK
ncbi:MAG: D-alanyl-D-alanine carboxypeptidase family protein [Patescibacteria group bacterium]|jgi:D-alanyl-D-alanine carboxypeptidase (penicillin-binding protein 5/6)